MYGSISNMEETPSKYSVYNFYGLNRTRRTSRGEAEEMENMSTLEYPCAAPRGRREVVIKCDNVINAVAAPDRTTAAKVSGLTGVMGGAFYYNGTKKSKVSLPSGYDWKIVRMGNLYIINGYDKANKVSVMYYYNIDTDKFDYTSTVMENLIVYTDTDKTGNFIETFRYGFDEVIKYVAKNEDTGEVIKNADFFTTYAGGSYEWNSETETFDKLEGIGSKLAKSDNIFESNFSVGDYVIISGFPTEEENFGQVWTYNTSNGGEVIPQTNQDFSRNNVVDVDTVNSQGLKDCIVSAQITGFQIRTQSVNGIQVYMHRMYLKLLNKDGAEVDFDDMSDNSFHYYCSGVRIESFKRTFTDISVHLGRIFGTVPSGNAIYSNTADLISDYSGDAVNKSLAAALPCDTPGVFTGLCEYGNELIAFKEDNITIIGGYEISSLYTHTIFGIGCIDKNSIAVTPNGVIFLAHTGFYIFTGNTPQCISSKLKTKYKSAVAGFDGNIYYASALRTDGVYELLTYDLRYGTWHVQDDMQVSGFFRFLEKFYFTSGNSIYLCDSDSEDAESNVEWSFTHAMTHDNTLDNKAVSEIWIRADVEPGASFKVFTKIDDDEWRCHSEFAESGLHVFRCPVRARTGNAYRWKLKGKGKTVIYEVEIHRDTGDGRQYKDMSTTTHSVTAAEYNDIEPYM